MYLLSFINIYEYVKWFYFVMKIFKFMDSVFILKSDVMNI